MVSSLCEMIILGDRFGLIDPEKERLRRHIFFMVASMPPHLVLYAEKQRYCASALIKAARVSFDVSALVTTNRWKP